MNYYPFHIGDYASATRHLSWDEDCAYRRLLDVYYTSEKPLPAELRAVCRLAMATTDAQREAVQIVLEEFFTLTPDGWANGRADVELHAMREKQQKQRDKANKRWQKPAQEHGNASAMPQHEESYAAASKSDADAMPPTPTPTPTPIVKGSAEPQGDSPPAGDLGSAELLAGVEPDGPIEPPVVTIPLVDGSEFPVTEPMVADWELAYPAVDVRQQLREMRAWCNANRAQRKTARGVSAFIVRWLGKEQDRGGQVGGRGAVRSTEVGIFV